ncbi:putative NADH-cytochrome b5 reductase 2 [Tilletiaria anomala UBC 951]|uniref:cytochrome-b5 reductase n=1 Tax=Tilletiaria anomala (strain ATCC 24038 / CBS 436.72 / UBC 951) TaxID=1037660 RepID=A0A066WNI4_TILAU|nr:putative NADH-cytochrome b5 reductase 2 [Tilletiaria anomala UBC 951]KDN52564.1 putative NADH-cytochrome b5 reductase 2 [Tilletiaria anomala UBC 951]
MIRPAITFAACACRSSGQGARAQVRAYASSSGGAGNSSNLPLVLGLGGLAGLGGWYALGGFNSTDKAKNNAKELAESAKSQAKAGATSVSGALDKSTFKEFTLKEIKPYNHDSATLVFELPDNQTSGLSVASAVLLKAAEGAAPLKDKNGKDIIRPYTPVTTPDTQGHIDFLIKKYSNGNMSKYTLDLRPGDKIAIKGPIPKFQYQANEFEEIACIAGGSGITPMLQLVQAIRDNPEDKTRFTLIYTNKTEQDILCREEFDKLAKANPDKYKIIYGLDLATKGSRTAAFTGYITPEILSKYLPAPDKADRIKLFVCGPPPQVEAISGGKGPKGSQGELKGLLADAGYQPSQVYKF